MPEGVEELPVPGRIVSGMVIGISLVALGEVDVGSAVVVVVVFAVVLGSVTSDTMVLSRPPMPPRRPSSVVEDEETTPVGASRMPDELDDDVGTDDTDSDDESADAVEFADRVGRGVLVFDVKVGSTMSGGTVGSASSEVPLELLLGTADAGKVSTSSPEPVAAGSVLEGFGVTTMVLAMMTVVTLPSPAPFVGLVLKAEAEVLELLLPPSKLPSRPPRSDSCANGTPTAVTDAESSAADEVVFVNCLFTCRGK